MSTLGEKIVVLIDMDCFFCQVEVKLNPSLKGKPLAVIQYSSFGPGSIIAVNYEARDFGVTRHMKANEAKEKCPNITLVTVPPLRNKPDTGRYRVAGKEVIDVLKKSCAIIERASVDEAYLDITEMVDKKMGEINEEMPETMLEELKHTFVVGHCDDESNDEEKRTEGIVRWLEQAFDDLGDYQARRLAVAGLIVEKLRADIYSQCEYRCSAGISYNKILAKLACGLHKPNRQTILPAAAVPTLYSTLPVKKVRNLGGKFGNIVMESLNCNVMADLLKYSLQDLQRRFDEKTGSWLYNIARGIDTEPVQNRLVCKSIGSSKNFPGKQAITKLDVLKKWANELSIELVDRLEQDKEENDRRATSLTINYSYYLDKKSGYKIVSQSKVCSLPAYKVEKIRDMCVNIIVKATQNPITLIGMSATKFVANKESGSFIKYFTNGSVNKDETISEETGIESNSKNESIALDKLVQLDKTDQENETLAEEQKMSETILDREQKLNEIELDSSKTLNESIGNNAKSTSEKLKKLLQSRRSDESKSPEKFKKPESPKILKKKIIEVDLTDEKSLPDEKIDPPEEKTGCLDFNSTISEEKFQDSFFMNIFKNCQPSTSKQIEANSESEKRIEIREEEDCNQSSPDLFDDEDCKPQKQLNKNEEQINAEDDQDEQTNEKNPAIAKLREIFPDFNNIDLSVVELLPTDLQKEVRALMKTNKSSTDNTFNPSPPPQGVNKTLKVTAKGKAKKGKRKESNNTSIQSFFLKNDPDDFSMKKCPECSQMIVVEKFFEHLDFHVAQNLQRSLNNQSFNTPRVNSSPSMKRKSEKKRSPVSNKKIKSISSFFN